MDEQNKTGLAELTSEIVAAYVANNSLPAADLPALISSIHQTIESLGQAPAPSAMAWLRTSEKSLQRRRGLSIDEDHIRVGCLGLKLATSLTGSPTFLAVAAGLPCLSK